MSDDVQKLIELDRKHVWHHLSQHKAWNDGTADPIIFVEGKGMRVTDIKGKEYLDAVAGGVWTVNVGYGRKEIVDAVSEQLLKLCYFANSFGSIPGAKFAEKLIEKMPGMSRVYLSNSGSEANEKAYKIVRQISQFKYNGKKSGILYRNRDYHGTTITTLSSCGQEERRMQYGPYTPGFVEFPAAAPYRNPFGLAADDPKLGQLFADQLEETILANGGADAFGAVIVEPITAGGGVLEPPKDYLQKVKAVCQKYDLLLIIDEVVCGLGRTGKWFGYQHFDVQPDIVTMAKGVASGYAAISCTVTTEAVFQDFIADPSNREQYFRDISTFGGCNAGPAAALKNIEIIENENLIENTAKIGDYFLACMNKLKEKYAFIGDVRGKGLFCGMELVKDRETKEPVAESVCAQIAAHCMKNGVIIGRTNRSFKEFNNTLCFSPALISTEKEIDEIIAAVDAAMAEVKI